MYNHLDGCIIKIKKNELKPLQRIVFMACFTPNSSIAGGPMLGVAHIPLGERTKGGKRSAL